jgi:drug/metabolite transporter (DMT)-like permease
MSFVYMMFSVLSWSLFPLISVWGINQLGVFDYILWTYVVGLGATCLLLQTLPRSEEMALPKVSQIKGQVLWEIFVGCLSVLLSFACLLIAFSYISRASATVVFEIWPIIAMYITPLLIKKGWEKISTRDMTFSILAFIGVVFLLYPETQNPLFTGGFTLHGWYRLLLPLLGGVFMAVASVMKSRVSYNLENKKYPVASLLKVQAFFSAGVVLLALPFALLWPDKHSVYTPENIMAIFFIGIVTHTLGNVCYTMSVLRAAKPNIVVLWYLMPIFAVVWLWLAGEAEITEYIVLGSIFIVTANLIITVRAERSMSYTATMIALLVCGLYTYFVDGLNMDDYYQALSVPIVFYVILVAFMMDRLMRRDRLEEGLAIEMINYIEERTTKLGRLAQDFSAHIVGMITTNDPAQVNRHYRAVRNGQGEHLSGIYNQLDQLVLSKVEGTSFAETFILFIVGMLTVVTATVYRPNNLIADGFAIILSLTVIFIFFTILDLSDKRRRFYLERDYKGERMVSALITRDLLSERVISALLLLLILVALLGLLWMKHAYLPWGQGVVE